MQAISDYSEAHIRPGERIQEAPELLWSLAKGSANEKQSRVLVNYQDEESKRIGNQLAIATLQDKARQEKATATRLESEARIAQTKEIEARLDLLAKLKNMGVVPLWDHNGNERRMAIVKVGEGFDWNGLTHQLLDSSEKALVLNGIGINAATVETDSSNDKPTQGTSPPREPSH